ncbi:hypothetical protein BJX99DRAFT_256100 [Aspergillus californicus]
MLSIPSSDKIRLIRFPDQIPALVSEILTHLWPKGIQRPEIRRPEIDGISGRTLSWLCISFDSADLLHLINAPTELATALIDFFGERIEKCDKDFVSGNFELKFKDSPWLGWSGKYSELTTCVGT